jgi:hypothetical protein
MNEREQELSRLYDLSVGPHWLADDQNVLIAALRNVEPAYFNGNDHEPITLTADDRDDAIALYEFVAASTLSNLCRNRICQAAAAFLATVMSHKELAELKASAPLNAPKYSNILEELAAEGIS